MQTLIRRIGIAVACFLFELSRMLFSNSVCRRVEYRLWLCLYSIGRQMSANLCFVAAVRYIQSSKARATTTKTLRKCILVRNCRSLISRWKGNGSLHSHGQKRKMKSKKKNSNGGKAWCCVGDFFPLGSDNDNALYANLSRPGSNYWFNENVPSHWWQSLGRIRLIRR